jgi:hypothetical protein
MTMRALFAFGLLLAALVVGCDRSGEPGSCYRASMNTCLEYTQAQGGTGKKICSGDDAKWTSGAGTCPKENRVGACARDNGEVTEVNYSGAPMAFTTDQAKSTCSTIGGKWTAP